MNEISNKLMPMNNRKTVMIDAVYEEKEQSGYTVCRGIALRETSKGWYSETNKKMLFAFQGAAPEVGAIYALEAHLVSDTTYNALYQVDHAELLACASYAAMTTFLLRSEDATPKRVRLLLEKYGMDVLAEIADDYYALDFLDLSPDVQSGLYIFAAKRLLLGIALQLLMKYTLDCRLTAAIYDTYKNDSLEKTVSTILDNPYTLFTDAVWSLLKQTEQTEGVPKDIPCPFTAPDITQAISQLKERKLIVWDKVGDKNGIYLRDSIISERTVTR